MSISTAPAVSAVAITPNDTTVLATTRALYVGGAGAVKVRMKGSQNDVTFAAVTAGTLLPICVDRVYDTDTDATGIVGLL